MKKSLSLFLILSVSTVWGQITVAAIIDSVQSRFNRIQDYSVQIKLTVDMEKFRMPRKRINVYFKQPDKLKIESDGFAIVPRQGVSVPVILDSLKALTLIGDEVIINRPCWVIKGLRREGNWQLNTSVWVDKRDWVITQVISHLDTVEIARIQLDYTLVDQVFLLPVKTTVTVQAAPEMTAKLGHFDPDRQGDSIEQRVDKSVRNGTIILEFSRYRVNRGIKDSFFNDSDW